MDCSQSISSIKKVIIKDQNDIHSDKEINRIVGIMQNLLHKSHGAVLEFQIKNVTTIDSATFWFRILHHFTSSAIIRWKCNPSSSLNLFSIHSVETKVFRILALLDSIYFHISRALKVSSIYANTPANKRLILLEPGEQIIVSFLFDVIYFIFTGR